MENLEKQGELPAEQDADARLDEIQMRQITDLSLLRNTIGACLAELKLAVGDAAMFDELPELLDPSNFEVGSRLRKNKLRAIYQALIHLPAYGNALKILTEEMITVFALEHEILDLAKANAAVAPVDPAASRNKELDAIDKKYAKFREMFLESEQRRIRESVSTLVGSGGRPLQDRG